jgi:hypothetical protein
VSWAAGRVDVFVRGTDNGIWHGLGTLPATQCTTAQLAISLQNQQGSAGHQNWDLTFTNTSATPCAMTGFPGVSWVNGAGARIGRPVARTAGFDFGPVVLPPGSAIAHLSLADVFDYPGPACAPVLAAGIRVFPPNRTTSKIIAEVQPVCSNPGLSGWSTVTTVFSSTVA